ncbi:protein kinase domain-containing protein [Kitasatospora sp. SC0581]|uniref:protein kinase domain-containing protein n=1 Tax=Kitasatospora sp. SC0581 TaxID=3394360 RepID=UPI003A8A2CA5
MKPLSATDPQKVGPYRLVARLGSGGMGQVFLGRSPGGLSVAVKLVRPELAENAQFRQRFAHEIEAARRVGGFYTAQVVDADPEADQPWLVTAYIPGPSLREAVDRYGPMPAETVTMLGAGLAEGLAAIHACSVVHRDLKPGNVILAADGPRVIDFGIARALDTASGLTRTAVIGTPSFMSPEQFRGSLATPESDVFSLAAVLMYAAAGRGPFGDGPTPEAVGYRVVHHEPDLTGLPPVLAQLIASCLDKDPKQRPSVAQVLDHCAGQTHLATAWLPPNVTAMITEQAAETSKLTTVVSFHPPTEADRQALTEERTARAPGIPPLVAKARTGRAGYSTVTLPWIPGVNGGAKRTTVVRWLRQVGDTISKGDPLLEVTSGRGDVLITAPESGILYAIHRQAGASARIGTAIAGIGTRTARIPASRRVRYTWGGVATFLVLALIAGAVCVLSPLFEEEDISNVQVGDCIAWESPSSGWYTMPCGLMEVRNSFKEAGPYVGSGYYKVFARLPPSSDKCPTIVVNGSNVQYNTDKFDSMALCTKRL